MTMTNPITVTTDLLDALALTSERWKTRAQRAEGALELARKSLRERRDYHRHNLNGWSEPDGLLIPTEPDPDERLKIRALLAGAIVEIGRILEVLGESPSIHAVDAVDPVAASHPSGPRATSDSEVLSTCLGDPAQEQP